MKECSGKKVLIVKVSQNDPLDLSSQKNSPGGQQDQEHYQSILTFKMREDKYNRMSMRCPKFRKYNVSPNTLVSLSEIGIFYCIQLSYANTYGGFTNTPKSKGVPSPGLIWDHY